MGKNINLVYLIQIQDIIKGLIVTKKQVAVVRSYSINLQACPLFNKISEKKHNFSKRVSFFTSKIKGSLTIEAAFVMPIFLFAILNLLSITDMLDIQMRLQAAMHQTAKEMSVYGYAYDKLTSGVIDPGVVGNVAFNEIYVRNKVNTYITTQVLDKSCIKNGSRGVTYSFSNIMGDDCIDLVAYYRFSPRFSMIPFPEMVSATRAKVRAFTGYNNTQGSNMQGTGNEEYVFITESGTAYHRDRNCTHLRLSLQLVDAGEVGALRNENGGRYNRCRSCGQSGGGNVVVIITNLGDRYHTRITCTALKRTVEEVPLSQAAGYHPCSRCGGD